MKTKSQKKHDKLFEIADSQQGYFTSKQAQKAGYIVTNHPYHVQTGAWAREGRGIYRLKNFPHTNWGQYIVLTLWSRDRNDNPQGVISHETALAVHELSDINPSKIHMTVPPSFRKWAKVPGVLNLYYGKIDLADTENRLGFRVTTPLRTLTDVIEAKTTSPEFVEQAFNQALDRGLIRIRELESPKVSEATQKIFKNLLKIRKQILEDSRKRA